MRWLLFIGIVTLHVAMAIKLSGEDKESGAASVGLGRDRQHALNSVTQSLSKFADNFYPVLAKDKPNDNLVCSPISVSIGLSMLAFGARGNTKVQLDETLAFSENQTIEKDGIRLLIDSFNEYTNVTLRFANKIYLSNDDTKPKFEFTRLLKNSFNSDLEKVDFADPQRSSNIINKWVENKTDDRIKNIIQPDDVNMNKSLILVNTVYLKGEWNRQFYHDETSNSSFWVDGITKEFRTTMYSNGYYKYGELEEVNADFVELPYKSEGTHENISMFIILPKEINGLKTLEENFNKITVQKLVDEGSYTREIHVYLPKFEIESEMSLEKPLQQLGLTDMFTSEADFTDIASGLPLQVSQIKQKVFIKIDEKGSEPTTYGGAITDNRFFYTMNNSEVFKADHPFVAIIAKTGDNPVNLFTLRYTGKE